MQQYFINEDLNVESTYELSKDDSNHIVRIMRKKIEDKVYVVFNNEVKYICTIVDNNVDKVLITPYEQVIGTNELSTKITVAIPPLKNDKIEYLMQKLTELGVSNIVLFNSERNVAKVKKDKVDSKLNRWNKIVKEAAEQSKRNVIPDITYVDSLKDLIAFSEKFNHKVVAYEKESVNEENINLKNLLHSDLSNKEVIAVFGSEGGLSEQEISGYDFQVQQFGQTKLISFSGWYDYSFGPEKSKEEHLRTKTNFWFDRRLERQLDDPSITAQTLQELEKLLMTLDGPIIVALHFVPHQDFLYDHPYFQRFNAFLGSQAFHRLFVKYLSLIHI